MVIRGGMLAAAAALLDISAWAATMQWARTYSSDCSALWTDASMWTVTGEDEDGIPDGDDDVFFGVQSSGD